MAISKNLCGTYSTQGQEYKDESGIVPKQHKKGIKIKFYASEAVTALLCIRNYENISTSRVKLQPCIFLLKHFVLLEVCAPLFHLDFNLKICSHIFSYIIVIEIIIQWHI